MATVSAAALRQRITEMHTETKLRARAQMVLEHLEGVPIRSIAAARRCRIAHVTRWLDRFDALGFEGLRDRPRSGAPRKVSPDLARQIAGLLAGPPPANGRRWTPRQIASATGYAPTTIRRFMIDGFDEAYSGRPDSVPAAGAACPDHPPATSSATVQASPAPGSDYPDRAHTG